MNVLLLGDSHTHGAYGESLEALFKAAGHTVTRVGWVSATATHYLNGKYKKLKLGHTGDYDSQVKGKNFDLAIVSLGTNEAGGVANAAQAQSAIANIQKLIGTFSAPNVFWVGPPAFSPNAARTYNPAFAKMDLNQRAALIWAAGSAAFGPRALDPRGATQAHTLAKNIHLGPAGGKAWAQYVFANATGVASQPPVAPDPADAAAGSVITANVMARPFPWVPVAVGGGVLVLGVIGVMIWSSRRAQAPAMPARAAVPDLVPTPAMAGLFSRWSR